MDRSPVSARLILGIAHIYNYPNVFRGKRVLGKFSHPRGRGVLYKARCQKIV